MTAQPAQEPATSPIEPLHAAEIPATARTIIDVDLAALRANWTTLARAAGPRVQCAGVVKADGYGLGLEPVARALAAAGCVTFFAATIEEGRRLRSALPSATIYILDGLLPGTAPVYDAHRLRPVLSSLDEISEWAAYAQATGHRLPAALQFDTGMRRMGLPPADIDDAADRLDAAEADIELALLVSHLACADTADHPLNQAQIAAFDRLRARWPGVPASLANSAGIMLGATAHCDLLRPGIALYGGRATAVPHPNAARLRPVVRLSARILQVRDAAPGDAVGYGAAYGVTAQSRIATVACGYADGFPRACVSGTPARGPHALLGAYPAPLVGRISMDLTTIDVTGIPERLACRGAWVELIGSRTTIDDVADAAGTIAYEVLTRLGPRAVRRYHDAPDQSESA